MRISVNDLTSLTRKAIVSFGYTSDEAEIILKVLMFAQLRGNNQGVVKLIGSGIPMREGNGEPVTVKETTVSALIDGNGTHAMLVMDAMTDRAILKAKEHGMAIVGNFNTTESTGALGYYVDKIASEGLIGFAYASAPFMTTAPYGSTEPLFCTNPFAVGIPTSNDPFLLDMSTSEIAYYGLIEAKTAGVNVSEGCGFDASGAPTTDPAQIMSGAIKAFGGHKGSALALMVQLLAGSLVEADSFDNESDNAGNLVMAIDPSILTNKERFKNENSEIIERIRSAKRIGSKNEIFVAGERGYRFKDGVLESGEIDIQDNLLSKLKEVAGE